MYANNIIRLYMLKYNSCKFLQIHSFIIIVKVCTGFVYSMNLDVFVPLQNNTEFSITNSAEIDEPKIGFGKNLIKPHLPTKDTYKYIILSRFELKMSIIFFFLNILYIIQSKPAMAESNILT